MKKKNLILMVGVALLASCMDNNNVYDPNKVKEDAKANFPIKNIDPTQDWATRGTRTLDVTVNEKAGMTYTIKVFTANPLQEEQNARLLTESEVKNGSTTTLTFDVSLDLDYVYVMCKAGEKDYSVSAAPLVGDKFTTSFGKSVGTRAYDLDKGIEFSRDMTKVDPKAKDIDEAIDFKQVVSMSGTHKIDAGRTCELSDAISYMGEHLYISGTLKASSLELSKKSAISILEGGKLILGGLLKINGGEFYNAGTVTVGSTEVNSTLVFDAADRDYGKFQNVNTYNSESQFMVNGGSVAQNDCKLNTNKLAILGNVIFAVPAIFNNGGYVNCSILNIANSNLNLSGKSVLSASTEAFLTSGVITGPASGDNYPLFKSPRAKATTSTVVVANTVYVDETSDNTFVKQGFKSVKVLTIDTEKCTPEYTTDKDPTVDIPMSGCTIGFEDVNKESSTDYDFNDVVLWVSNVDKTGYAHIYLVAAGATNSIKVGYTTAGGRTGYIFDGKEVHELLNISAKQMFNTSGSVITEGLPVFDLQVAQPTLDGCNFFIEVNGDTDNLIYSKNGKEYTGQVPFALCVSEDWNYPIEKANITTAYPDFGLWGANKDTNKTWYKNGNSEHVRPFNSALLK